MATDGRQAPMTAQEKLQAALAGDSHARQAMTGDDLITLVVEAPSSADALAIVRTASVGARYQACDLLWLDADAHGMPWMMRAIVSEARA
jgi:hypothetical protein